MRDATTATHLLSISPEINSSLASCSLVNNLFPRNINNLATKKI